MIKSLIFLLFLFYCCYNSSFKLYNQAKTVSVFRSTDYYNDFYIRINNDFSYEDRDTIKGNGVFGYLITKYPTKSNTIKIYLRVNSRDTTFSYNVSKYDSLMIGLGDKYFFVFNEKEYVWAKD